VIELPTTVIADDDGVDTEPGREIGILGAHHAL